LYRTNEGFHERTAFRFALIATILNRSTAQLCAHPGEADAHHFSTPQLVELAAAIAWENYRARSNRVFGFGSEGFYKAKGVADSQHEIGKAR
jgi:alkylhydroperoxidase family enzyme